MKFSKRLLVLRTRAGLSIPALARLAKLSPQAIHRLERGEREPSLATAKRLAKAMKVSISDFDHQLAITTAKTKHNKPPD